MASREKISPHYDMLVEEAAVEELRGLGWDGACAVGGKKNDVKDFDLLSAAVVSGDVRNKAREALKKHDLAYFKLGGIDENRKASECWELDAFILTHDYVKNERPGKKPALDYVSLKNMTERGIYLIIPLNLLVEKTGFLKALTLDCLKRTARLARKAKTSLILASGAKDASELRSWEDLAHYGSIIGVPKQEIKRTVSDNPHLLAGKARDRKNPDIILSGLKVLEWGELAPRKEKGMFGWY